MDIMPSIISDLGDRLHVCCRCHRPILKDKRRRIWVHTQKQSGCYWRFVEACDPDSSSITAYPIIVEGHPAFRSAVREDVTKIIKRLRNKGMPYPEIARRLVLPESTVRFLLKENN